MTIRTKLTIAFFLFLLLIGGPISFLATHFVRSAWKSAKREDLLSLLQVEKAQLLGWVSQKVREVSELGLYNGFRTNDLVEQRRQLQNLHASLRGIVANKELIFVNQHGQIIYSDRLVPKGSQLEALLVQALPTTAETESPHVSTFLSQRDGESATIIISAPRWSERGVFLGTVNALINLSTSQLGKTLQSFFPTLRGTLTLFDSSGTVLFQVGPELDSVSNTLGWRRIKKSGNGEGVLDIDGVVVAHAGVPELRWIVTIWQSKQELNAEILKTEDFLIKLGLAGVIVAFFLAFFISRSISNPIEQLIEKTKELKEGSFIPLQEDVSGEIGQLLRSFNEMAYSLQKGQKKLKVLNELGEAIISDIRLNNILERICNKVIETMEVESCSIYLIDPDNVLRIKTSIGLTDEEREQLQFNIGEGLTGRVFQEKRGIIINDVASDPRAMHLPHRRGAKKLLCLPLLIRDEPRGVMNIHNKKDGSDFTIEDLELLSIFASQATVAVENFRLFREVSWELQRVTELQTRLIQSEKLSAIGQLVAGVAHEINNPLGIILGYADLLLRKTQDPSSKKSLHTIIQATQRAAGIVKNLLAFARKQEPTLVAVNLNDVVHSVLELLQHQLKVNNILVFTDLSESIPSVRADVQQLQQVFFNLVTNAMQAMEGMKDGRIVIETRQRNGTVIASITDNGPGIKPEHLTRLFEPFFTTKPVGRGTGLGLSICYGIIKEFGGEITVSSAPGKGATFVIELPVLRTNISEGLPANNVAREETRILPYSVLVVDDEESIVLMLKDSLESYGARVITAESGETALKILEKEQFDVIVSDFKMPGMNGKEFYEECLRRFPLYAKRFVFSSGDIVTEDTRQFFTSVDCEVIHKPYALQEIVTKVQIAATK